MGTAIFVTGSGTDVGKTYVSASLLHTARAAGLRVRACKPLASGLPPSEDDAFAASDTAVLLAASGVPFSPEALDLCSPWRFAAPLSPDMAAAAEGRRVAFTDVVDWTRSVLDEPGPDLVLVEGVGGVMSPVTEDATNLDLIHALRLPVLLVCGSYLGAVSHGLSALAALQARGAEVAALVVNETPSSTVELASTVEVFQRFANPVPVRTLRRNEAASFGWLTDAAGSAPASGAQ